MAVFKCKMCGASLSVEGGSTVATCEYCGSSQTLPVLSDEKLERLYDRASHYRRNNEFDKAMAIYEQILNDEPSDSESYWSIVLCKYGIEYVEDPRTKKRKPTVNRTQYTSVFDDDNYKMAIKYADDGQKAIYEAEAKEINEIQKQILEISAREEPFDVFICYKETDSDGRRTRDSVYANELYHELTREGFKVFFAKITLEDKLGIAYEPYIFSALTSSKVMVVLGTNQEYFNAVWVKNEWSRFLAMMKAGERKTLIPAYRDMDPYDLPEEFSHLQALDMDKLGFMPDLVRGIKKILGYEQREAFGYQSSANYQTGAYRTPNSYDNTRDYVAPNIPGGYDARVNGYDTLNQTGRYNTQSQMGMNTQYNNTAGYMATGQTSSYNTQTSYTSKLSEKDLKEIEKLEKDRNANLIAGVILVFFFWPVSVILFIKAGQKEKKISEIKNKK